MNFDLNINNYTIEELESMFELSSNYDKNMIDDKEYKLKETIMNNKEINKETRIKTINFLRETNSILKNNFEKNNDIITDMYNTNNSLKTIKIEDTGEHMVQDRGQVTAYANSFPSEFFKGIINPLKKRTLNKFINIDTRFRENYYTSASTNFNVVLPILLKEVISLQLTGIELPETFYSISKQYGNNYFTITVTDSDSIEHTTIINIPSGNYDYVGMMRLLNTLVLNLGAPFSQLSFNVNITNGTNGSGETVVGIEPGSTIQSFTLNFQKDKFGNEDMSTPLPLKFGWILGFRNGIYVNNLVYVSEGVMDVLGFRYLYLVVDDYNNNVNNNFYSAFNSSLLNKNILARISLQGKQFDIMSQNALSLITPTREYFGPVNIQNLTIQLLDEYGRIVDLNNMDYSFCLSLKTAYDI